MKFNISMDRNVIVALSAHGVTSAKIAEYLVQGVAKQVETAVNSVLSELDIKEKK